MSPIVKRLLAVAAVKKAWDGIQEARRPKRSRTAKAAPGLIGLGLVGIAGYLYKSGKLQSLMGGSNSPYEPAAYPTGSSLSDAPRSTSTITNGQSAPEPANV